MTDYCLAIIGAGQAALPIIEKAKQMSVKVLAFARKNSLAETLVDIFIEENYFDVDFMVQKCLEYGVHGVMATSELTTEVAAKLANRLNLPGNDIKDGFGGKDKFVMRTRVSQLHSIKQPEFQLYSSRAEYIFPLVVKPTDACGKRGVGIAYNKIDLRRQVQIAAANSTTGEVLVEEYLAGGKEYSIECLSFNGIHQVIQYTEKESSGPPHFVETAHHQPADLPKEMKQRINVAVNDILSVLGLNCGMAHLELKIIDGQLFFIEVGARGGGDHIADFLTIHSTDFDYYKAAIECSLGIYRMIKPHTVAHTGIYFHCLQNRHLEKLFHAALTETWCINNTVRHSIFQEVSSNEEASNCGYIIYKSNHKIGISDCQNSN